MCLSPAPEETFRAHEAARAAGISKNTLLRWLKQGKVHEVARDRNGWRIFSRRDIEEIAAFARKTTPPGTGSPAAGEAQRTAGDSAREAA